MQYDLSKELDKLRFKQRANALYEKGEVVELSVKKFRTRSQNSYLHLLIGVVAMECGVSLEYAKQEYFKRLVNPGIFVKVVKDKYAGDVQTLRSFADVSTEEMSQAIDRFKRWGAENGMYLPDPEDKDILRSIEIEMGRISDYIA